MVMAILVAMPCEYFAYAGHERHCVLAPKSQLQTVADVIRNRLGPALGDILNLREREKLRDWIPVSLRLRYPMAELPVHELLQ